MRWNCFVILCLASSLGGCPAALNDDSARVLIGIDDGRAYVEYYEEYSGFVTTPASVWQIDVTTGKTNRVQPRGVQYSRQVGADYLVDVRATQDDERSRIVARQISTGDEIVVLERDIPVEQDFDGVFAVAGLRVIAITNDGALLIYDLATRRVERTISIDKPNRGILAASADWTLLIRDEGFESEHLPVMLVNLQTAEVLLVPPLPDDHFGLFFDTAFSGEQIFTASFGVSEDDMPEGAGIWALHIPSLTWRMIADYPGGFPPFGDATFVRGAEEGNVLVERYSPLGGSGLELIDPETGDQTEFARAGAGFFRPPLAPLLKDRQVHWIDEIAQTVSTYDIESGELRTLTLNVPN